MKKYLELSITKQGSWGINVPHFYSCCFSVSIGNYHHQPFMDINIRSPYFLLSVLFTGKADIPIIFSEVVLRDEILTQHKLKEPLDTYWWFSLFKS